MAKGRKQPPRQRSPLQQAGGKFLDHLGKAAIEKLKVRLGLNTEEKYADSYNISATSTTPVVLSTSCTTAIAQGLTDNTREGSTVRATKHSWKGTIYNGAANTNVGTIVRVVATRWKPTSGANISSNVDDVLEGATTSGIVSTLSAPTEHPVYENHIFFDRTFALGATADFSQANVHCFEFSYSPDDFHLAWTTADTAGTTANSIGDMVTMIICCSGATASNFPSVATYQRVEYVDN
jgi:hypothetical protein